jgi:hypothetical protein
MKLTAYVYQDRLCLIGVHDSKFGPIPVSHHMLVDGIPDGPCDLSGEGAPDGLEPVWEDAKGALREKLDLEMMRAGAEDLVKRANAGDQVARAQMSLVRDNAKRGLPRAVKAYELLLAEAKRAKGGRSTFGIEQAPMAIIALAQKDKQDPYAYPTSCYQLLRTDGQYFLASCILLANGPDLDRKLVESIAENFGENEVFFAKGYALCAAPQKVSAFGQEIGDDERRALRIGQCVGCARMIQKVRSDGPIKSFSPAAGWELGE